MPRTAVIGLGNPYVRDEGIGIRVVSSLAETYDCADVDVYDLGTASFRILHIIESREKIIIIDCALMGTEPGTIRRFTFDQARSVKVLRHHSLHEGDLFEVMALTGSGEDEQPDIVVFGVEPEDLALGEGLSSVLEKRLPDYLDAVARECGLRRREGP